MDKKTRRLVAEYNARSDEMPVTAEMIYWASVWGKGKYRVEISGKRT